MDRNADSEIQTPEDLRSRTLYRESLAFGEGSGRALCDVIGAYHFPPDMALKCGIESCRTLHQKGFLVSTTDGLETNIGNQCGQKHLGADFTQKRKAYLDRAKKSQDIEIISTTMTTLHLLEATLSQIESQARHLFRLQRTLTAQCHPLKNLLISRAKSGNASVFERRAMSEQEARREYFHTARNHDSKKDPEEQFQDWRATRNPTKDVQVGTINGLSFMLASINETIQKDLIKPYNELKGIDADDLPTLSSAQLTELKDWSNSLESRISAAEKLIEIGQAFFSANNMGALRIAIKELQWRERELASSAIDETEQEITAMRDSQN